MNQRLFKPAVEESDNNIYTKKIQVPQYVPSNKKPHTEELMNIKKYVKLLQHSENSDISDDDKRFLRLAASRHIVFNYSKIADYYAHSDKQLQSLMEESALVILDFEDAIANGYVKLSSNIKHLLSDSGDLNGEE